jgi:hypothetical protein
MRRAKEVAEAFRDVATNDVPLRQGKDTNNSSAVCDRGKYYSIEGKVPKGAELDEAFTLP